MKDRYDILREDWKELSLSGLMAYHGDLHYALNAHSWRLEHREGSELEDQEKYDAETQELEHLRIHETEVGAEIKARSGSA